MLQSEPAWSSLNEICALVRDSHTPWHVSVICGKDSDRVLIDINCISHDFDWLMTDVEGIAMPGLAS